jgi:hypothetical protein
VIRSLVSAPARHVLASWRSRALASLNRAGFSRKLLARFGEQVSVQGPASFGAAPQNRGTGIKLVEVGAVQKHHPIADALEHRFQRGTRCRFSGFPADRIQPA